MTDRKFKKIKLVTIPLIKLVNNTEYYFKFTAAMRIGKVVDDKKEPPTLLQVIDLTTGEVGEIIIGSVLKQEIINAYGGTFDDKGVATDLEKHKYVGKCFEIVKHAPEGARKYSLWNIAEVEEPQPEPAKAPEAAKTEAPKADAKKK